MSSDIIHFIVLATAAVTAKSKTRAFLSIPDI